MSDGLVSIAIGAVIAALLVAGTFSGLHGFLESTEWTDTQCVNTVDPDAETYSYSVRGGHCHVLELHRGAVKMKVDGHVEAAFWEGVIFFDETGGASCMINAPAICNEGES